MCDNKFKQNQAPLPALYAILNIDELDKPQIFAQNLLIAGVRLIQLRNKSLGSTQALKIIKEILELRQEHPNARVLINDSIEIAMSCKADGVHLGQTDECPTKAREILGPDAIIGLSNHNLQQINQAPFKDLDYLALGPIFHSISKSGHAPEVGLEKLTEAVNLSELPLVAIGGINKTNAPDVFRTGVESVALISDLRNEEDLEIYNKHFVDSRRIFSSVA